MTYTLLPLRARGLEPFSINQTPVSGDILLVSQSWIREEVAQFWQEIKGEDLSSQLTSTISEALAIRSQVTQAPESPLDLFCEDNSIAFLGLVVSIPPFTFVLGTGCAQPSKYRNVSGIFLQVLFPSWHVAHILIAGWWIAVVRLW